MAGRPKIFDEQQALKKAANLFWERGYEATSTEQLMQVMGLHKGSFYNTFTSKKELFIRAFNTVEDNGFREFKQMLEKGDDPISIIKDAFLSLADCPKHEHAMGCFAGNTIAELTGIDEELVDKAKQQLVAIEDLYYKYIRQAQLSGRLKNKTAPRVLARYLLNLWNGINITRRIYPDKASLLPLIKLQLEILN